MKCEFCGHENEKGVKFCGKCGAQIPEKPTDNENKTDIKEAVTSVTKMVKTMPLKKILKFAVPAVLVIIVILIAAPLLRGSNFSIVKDSINIFTDGDEVIVSGNNNAKFTIDGELYSSQKSIDGSKAVVLTDYSYSSGGTLWFVTPSGSVRIADDVLAYKTSDSGSGVVYLTDYDSNKNIAALYLYDTSSKKATRITDEAMYSDYGSVTGICISPNGKTVSYISDYDSAKKELTGYIKIDGKAAEKLGDNMFALAISDGGKNIYYAKMTKDGAGASLNVRSGNSDNRLISDISSYGTLLILNKDYSQIIFNLDGKAYFSQNGSERVKIDNSIISALVLPRGSQAAYTYSGMSGITVYGYGVNSFSNTLAICSDGIVCIDNKFEASKISGSTPYENRASLSNDGKTLVYITASGNLSVIDPTKADAERKELAKDVTAFVASNDGKTIYYINDDDELWCIKGNGKPSKISDDVYTEYLALSYNSNKVFFLVDYSSRTGGQLYYSDNGGKRTKISGGDDVSMVWSTPSNIFFLTVDSELYRSSGNEKFVLFQDNADIAY